MNDDDSSAYEKLTGIWSGVNSCSDNSLSKQWKELILTFSKMITSITYDRLNFLKHTSKKHILSVIISSV